MKRFLFLVATLLLSILIASPFIKTEVAHAAFSGPVVVDSLGDEPDANPGDEVCATVSGACTFRAAIMETNAVAGADEINFSVSGTIVVTQPETNENAALDGDLDITDSLTIRANNNITIDGNATSRIFYVFSGNASFIGLTIQNGQGGIYSTTSGDTTVESSLITNSAKEGMFVIRALTIKNSTISNNTASSGVVAAVSNSFGPLTIENSTISGNNINFHGGLWSNASDVRIVNTTISGNVGTGDTFGTPFGIGGAVFQYGGSLVINNVTIANNVGSRVGGLTIIPSGSATTSVTNLILGNNLVNGTSKNCDDLYPFISSGHNLSSDGTCNMTQIGDMQNVSAQLSPLALNGSANGTFTHALNTGSPAINNGDSCLSTDQRGVSRPQGVACDMGAYEFEEAAATNGTVSGIKYWDENVNSQKDDAEVGLAGFQIQVYEQDGLDPVEVTSTDVNGNYNLSLPAGIYDICEFPDPNDPNFWWNSEPGTLDFGAFCYTDVLVSDGGSQTLNFGNYLGIKVEKTLTSADPAETGETVTFSLKVTNLTSENIPEVLVSDYFETAYFDYSSSGADVFYSTEDLGDGSGLGLVTWKVTNLSAGNNITIDVNFVATAETSLAYNFGFPTICDDSNCDSGKVGDLGFDTVTINAPVPEPSPSPSPSPEPADPTITFVAVHYCSPGSSCDGVVTFDVNGTNFTPDARVKLNDGTNDIFGTFVGGDGSTKILTDFTGLVSCQTYTVIVYFPEPDSRTVSVQYVFDANNCSSPSPSPSPEPSPEPAPEIPSAPTPDNSGSNPPACTAQIPGGTINLTGTAVDSDTVRLSWNKVSPATHYMVRYGVEPAKYIYGAPNIGNVNSFEVNGLSEGVTYYFQVAAANDCTGGLWSNEIAQGTSGGSLFEVPIVEAGETLGERTESTPTPKPSPTPETQEVLGETTSCEANYYPWWVILVIQLGASLIYVTFVIRAGRTDLLYVIPLAGMAILSQLIHNFLGCNCATGIWCERYWLLNLGVVGSTSLFYYLGQDNSQNTSKPKN